MFVEQTALIRAQLFLLQDLAWLQQLSNTHTERSGESSYLADGEVIILWIQSVRAGVGIYHLTYISRETGRDRRRDAS